MQKLFLSTLVGVSLGLSGTQVARAQFVAFNDHSPGAGTAPNTTIWSPDAATYPGGTSGFLKDATTGANLPVTVTASFQGNVTFEGTQASPSPGTPTYNTFNGFVDFQGSPLSSIALNGAGAVVTYTFTNLDPNKRYS